MPHRYYIDAPLEKESVINLSFEEEKHLRKVMRTQKGTPVEVINGHGVLAHCTYDNPLIVDSIETKEEPKFRTGLVLGLCEPKIIEMTVEKATELGIDDFYFFPAQKSKMRVLSDSKRVRINKILISALKQSKRLFLPTVSFFNKKEDLPKDLKYLLADFNGSRYTETKDSKAFIIGPESGFTEKEIHFFKENLSATPILLSKHVLRAETAAICAAHLIATL